MYEIWRNNWITGKDNAIPVTEIKNYLVENTTLFIICWMASYRI